MSTRAVVKTLVCSVAVLVSACALGCGDSATPASDGGDPHADAGTAVQLAGLRLPAVAIVVNPPVNEAHPDPPPEPLGERREGLAVRLGEGGSTPTDARGLVTFEDVPRGAQDIVIEGVGGPTVEIETRRELWVSIVATDGTRVQSFPRFPKRYALPEDRDPFVFRPGDDPAPLRDAALDNGRFIDIRDGVSLEGEGTLRARPDVALFGPALSGGEAWIDGFDLADDTAIWGLRFGYIEALTGLHVTLAHNRILGDVDGLVVGHGAFWNNAFCGSTELLMPVDDDALIAGNRGLPPLATSEEDCSP